MTPNHTDPPRRALYVPVEVADAPGADAAFTVIAPGDQGYEDAYAHCVEAYRAYGIPMPYADEEQTPPNAPSPHAAPAAD